MKLPAFFGHKRSVNLLPRDPFENSKLGAILEWGLVFGKWAVIVTQLIVMMAFLWRFGLDRRLTDVRKEMTENAAIIKSYEQVERDFVLAQKRVDFAKPIIESQQLTGLVLQKLTEMTPADTWMERLAVTETTVSFTAYAGSLSGFSRLLTNLQKEPMFNSVSVTKIQDGGVQGAAIQFDVAVKFKEEGKKP